MINPRTHRAKGVNKTQYINIMQVTEIKESSYFDGFSQITEFSFDVINKNTGLKIDTHKVIIDNFENTDFNVYTIDCTHEVDKTFTDSIKARNFALKTIYNERAKIKN